MLETDSNLISSDVHNAYVMADKTKAVIENHAIMYPNQPMFLYASLQLIHEGNRETNFGVGNQCNIFYLSCHELCKDS